MNAKQLEKKMADYIRSLDDWTLTGIYSHGGRIWMDSGDFELRVTVGVFQAAHDVMLHAPSEGIWVSKKIDCCLHDDHPCEDEMGSPDADWVPKRKWILGELLQQVENLVDELGLRVEEAEFLRDSSVDEPYGY